MKGTKMRDLEDFIIDFYDFEEGMIARIMSKLADESTTHVAEELLERAKILQDSGAYEMAMNDDITKKNLYLDLQNAEYHYYLRLMNQNITRIIKAYCIKHNKKMPDRIDTWNYLEELEDNE